MVIGHANRVVLGDELTIDHRIGVASDEHVGGIGAGAVCRLPVAIFREQTERPATQRESPAAVDIDSASVVRISRARAAGIWESGGILLTRHVLAEIGSQERRKYSLFQHHVDDASYGIGAVLGSSAVAKNLKSADRAGRNRVHVDAARPRSFSRTIVVNKRGVVPALSVEQHQRVIGAEAAHRERSYDFSGVGDTLARKIDGW